MSNVGNQVPARYPVPHTTAHHGATVIITSSALMTTAAAARAGPKTQKGRWIVDRDNTLQWHRRQAFRRVNLNDEGTTEPIK